MTQTKFTQKLFSSICNDIATTQNGLNSVCQKHGITSRTFYNWLNNSARLQREYNQARELQIDLFKAELIRLTLNLQNKELLKTMSSEQKSNFWRATKLQIDTLKFITAKLQNKKYT
ncbi:MAG: hypothetical protein KF900_07165 [Bacteroidetes bacterium]|nr:hypothetical protein [Bacteroidota bacterium]